MTVTVSLAARVLALAAGSLFGVLRTVPNRRWAAGAGAVHIALFRNVPLIVQFFVWCLVIPELVSPAPGNWFNIDIRLASAMVAFSLCEAAYYSEIIRAGQPRGLLSHGDPHRRS